MQDYVKLNFILHLLLRKQFEELKNFSQSLTIKKVTKLE